MKTNKAHLGHKKKKEAKYSKPENYPSTFQVELKNGKRYAHTASCGYQIMMASLQPDNKRLPTCACSMMNKGKPKSNLGDEVVLIIEHNLEEHLLCRLDRNLQPQCKLNVQIQPGEQVAFRTQGNIPVHLSGVSLGV